MTFSREPDTFDPEELIRVARALRKAALEQLSKSEAEHVAWAANRELNPAPAQPKRAPTPEEEDESYYTAMEDARSY